MKNKKEKIIKEVRDLINRDNQLWTEGIELLREAIKNPEDEGWNILAEQNENPRKAIAYLTQQMGRADNPEDWFSFAEGKTWEDYKL